MKIIVGSTNPVKIGAVEEVFSQYYSNCEVVGVAVGSGVSEQPIGEEETRRGAVNRAKQSIGNGEYGVGLEGGVTMIEGKMFECAWVAIVNRVGEVGLGGGLYFELPRKVEEGIRKGEELGDVINKLTGEDNVKQKMGAIGIFSKGKLDRKTAYKQIVTTAILKFVSPEWFV